jgi:hypothetical protein
MVMHDIVAVGRNVIGVHRTGTSPTLISTLFHYFRELHSPSPISRTRWCIVFLPLAMPSVSYPLSIPTNSVSPAARFPYPSNPLYLAHHLSHLAHFISQ